MTNVGVTIGAVVLLGLVSSQAQTLVSTTVPSALAASPAAAPKGKAVLDQLIQGARKEGQVNIFIQPTGAEEVAESFRRFTRGKFGLDLKLNLDTTGRSDVKTSQAVAETLQGITPTYDVQFDGSHNIIQLLEVKGVKRMDRVEQLLSEIAPQALPVLDKISPGPFRGRAFTAGDWIKAIIYNPKLISVDELPKTHIELGDPKYKGMFALPPWTSDADASILAYSKEEALEIVRRIGTNKAAIATEAAAVDRMLLGEFKFVDANANYYHMIKAKDAKAPIGLAFFRDYTTVNEAMYFVREGARYPNAATLFVLWHLSQDGNQAFEKATFLPSLYLPSSKIGQTIREQIKANGVKLASFFESEETLKKLQWLATPDGKNHLQALGKAWLGRK